MVTGAVSSPAMGTPVRSMETRARVHAVAARGAILHGFVKCFPFRSEPPRKRGARYAAIRHGGLRLRPSASDTESHEGMRKDVVRESNTFCWEAVSTAVVSIFKSAKKADTASSIGMIAKMKTRVK